MKTFSETLSDIWVLARSANKNETIKLVGPETLAINFQYMDEKGVVYAPHLRFDTRNPELLLQVRKEMRENGLLPQPNGGEF